MAKKQRKTRNTKSIKHIDQSVIQRIARDLENYNITIQTSEIRKAKDKFMDLYQKCDFAYKQMLVNYKIVVEGLESVPKCKPKKGEKRFDPENLKIVDTQVEKVFIYANFLLDKKLFCNEEDYKIEGNKSCRVLRNEITHSSSRKAIQEVFERKEVLYKVMEDYLQNFKRA